MRGLRGLAVAKFCQSQKPPKWGIFKICKVRHPQSGKLSKTPMSGSPRMYEIIRALQVDKHYWFSETAKCGDWTARRFSNAVKSKNPPSWEFTNSATSETPKVGHSQILQSQKPPKWETFQNANVEESADLLNYKSSTGGQALSIFRNCQVRGLRGLAILKYRKVSNTPSSECLNSAKSEPPEVENFQKRQCRGICGCSWL